MPPRHAYWTILVDNQATAFRAHDAEELLPTLNRLREKNASAVMKWFERGQLFDSREAAREQGFGRGERRWEGPRPERERSDRERERPARKRSMPEDADRHAPSHPPAGDSDRPRNRDWRPGGDHRDPRQKYQDAKKAKWQRFKKQIRERHERGTEERKPLESRPDRWRPKGPPRDRGYGDRGYGDRDRDRGVGTETGRPPFDAKRPPRKPWGSKPAGFGGRKPFGGGKPFGKKPWEAKPGGPARKPWGTKPGGPARKPWGTKPGGPARKPWGTKPGGAARKPWNSDRRESQARDSRHPSHGLRAPRRDWRTDRPPKKRKDEDE